jgi:hypothetical protein
MRVSCGDEVLGEHGVAAGGVEAEVAEQGRGDVQRDPGADEEVLGTPSLPSGHCAGASSQLSTAPAVLTGIECNWEHEANDAASIV